MNLPTSIILVAGVFAVSVTMASGQDESVASAEVPLSYCASNPGFADFDFWVGKWNVYSNDDTRQLQGTNSITKHYEACLLKEEWHGAAGGGGFSINYYNSVSGEWRQVWVADGYSIDYVGGLDKDGAMVLEGQIYGYQKNTATPFRGTWTPNEDGSVVQRFDVYDKANHTWTVWFEGLYVKKEQG